MHWRQKSKCAFCFMVPSCLKGQRTMLRWALFALFVGICASARDAKKKKVEPQPFSRGWGNNISWVGTYEEGLAKMVKSQKPLMVIHHQVDCLFSQELKKAFLAEKSIQKMAQQDFIMLNLVEETLDKNMAPDGYYVPRILFVDPSMTVRTDIAGKYSNHHYAYEAGDMAHLLKNMKKAKVLLHTEL